MLLPDFGDSTCLILSEGLQYLDGVPCYTHSHAPRYQWLKTRISRMDFSWVSSSAPHFQGTAAFHWGEASHIAGVFSFSCFTCGKLPVGENSLGDQASLYSDLLPGHQKFTKISLSLSFLLFCHCAVRAESSQLPNSLNNVFYHLFPFSEFHTHVSHVNTAYIQ